MKNKVLFADHSPFLQDLILLEFQLFLILFLKVSVGITYFSLQLLFKFFKNILSYVKNSLHISTGPQRYYTSF